MQNIFLVGVLVTLKYCNNNIYVNLIADTCTDRIYIFIHSLEVACPEHVSLRLCACHGKTHTSVFIQKAAKWIATCKPIVAKIDQSHFCKSISFNAGETRNDKKMHLSGKGVDSIDYGVVYL